MMSELIAPCLAPGISFSSGWPATISYLLSGSSSICETSVSMDISLPPDCSHHSLLPSFILSFALVLFDLMLVGFLDFPLFGDLFSMFPETDCQPCQESCSQRSCLGDHRAHDWDTQDIRLELAKEIIAGRVAIDAQLAGFDAGIF